jgi:hypothetical protein
MVDTAWPSTRNEQLLKKRDLFSRIQSQQTQGTAIT